MALGRLWVELDAVIGGFQSKMGLAVAEIKKLEKAHGDSASAAERAAKVGGIALAAIGVTVAGVGVAAVKMAGDFQASQMRLVTTAGESQANLKMVSDGVLDMAGRVGVSAGELSSALYVVESAGYHGADGLKVLEAASKGARIEGANVKEVADAVSSALVDYHLPADKAAEVTNTLVAAVGHGKTTMQDLSAAMPNVMSAAAAAGVSFGEAASALATMTMHGTDASTAGTYLRQVILGLENPSGKAAHVMKSLGLNANDVSQNLGKNGLANTIEMVENAINTHLNPAGLVAIDTLKKAHGSVTEFDKVMANLPASQKTAIGALADMVGGVKNLQGFLQLGGENLATFKQNTADVAEQVRTGGKDIAGWSEYQQTFNAKVASAKESLNSLMIKIGNDLLPVATKAMDLFSRWTGIMERNHGATVQIAGVIGGVLVTALAVWTAMTLKSFAVSSASFITDLIKGGIWVAGKLVHYTIVAGAAVISAATTAAAWIAANASMILATGGIILAIGLLVAAGYYVVTHWKQISHFFSDLWKDITRIFNEAIDWVVRTFKEWYPLILGILSGGILLLPALIFQHWHTLNEKVFKPVFEGIMAVVRVAWNDVLRPILEVYLIVAMTVIRGALTALRAVWEAVWSALSAAAKWEWENAIKPLWDLLMDGLHVIGDGLHWLSDTWDQVWGSTSTATNSWWNDNIKPIWDALVKDGLWFIRTEIKGMEIIWHEVWGWITDTARWAWDNVLRPVFGFIRDYGIKPVIDDINFFGDVWNSIWNGVVGAMNWAWGGIQRIAGWIADKVGGVMRTIDKVSGAIHSFAGSMGVSLPGFADGGWVPGGAGQPQLAIVHGGEYVLSQDMLAGRVAPDIPANGDRGQAPSGSVLASGRGGGAAMAYGGGGVHVHLEVHGSLTTERELFALFQTHVLQKALRNSTNGLTLAGR